MDTLFRKIGDRLDSLFGGEQHSHTHLGHECVEDHPEHHKKNRYHASTPQTTGGAKWYVDGASYFWAVSEAIEAARESIYILDWWLSPELYLRRPPSQNEQYRLDNMLKAAAERGVRIQIIVYKEVKAALTLDSSHTRHHLEALHKNIAVFRHPDHTPTGYDWKKDFGFGEGLSDFSLNAADLGKASAGALKALYGTTDDIVLFWAHHEKLCVIDGKMAFMGGLDMCFGRYDTSSHPLADAHPGNPDGIVFPGQDYNNARVSDFANVDKWEENKLDRTKSSRMGWTDVALCLDGPIVSSLTHTFKDRWNYIFDEKYQSKDPGKYQAFVGIRREGQPTEAESTFFSDIQGSLNRGMSHLMMSERPDSGSKPEDEGDINIQLVRSATKWSSGSSTEHSVANAYMDAITKAKHFVYIENQFFITATGNHQQPVMNKIGAAMVDRILRAHQAGEDFMIIVVMPAVPAFAGDLKGDGALGTRAIMEFQYNSISRGGHSILERLREEGIEDVSKYITFYNLRNYDRINVSSSGDQTWDSITACYMDGGPSLATIPWQGTPEEEMSAFVSEELYIHSKLLIADDRLVICGSANLNDRSQLGTHDSEIAVVIEDPTPVEAYMNGEPFEASKFAAGLRRFIFRKHLGLVGDQRWDAPDANWSPIDRSPNAYDWDSPGDILVRDPMHPNFRTLWTATARDNTEAFTKVFHNVPNDRVRTWADYDDFFSKYFFMPGGDAEEGGGQEGRDGKVCYGHVVPEEFPGGVQEVKECLGRVRGSLVEMPLDFLVDVDDIAKEGLELNALTDDLYT